MPIALRQERDQTMQPSRLVGPGSGVAKYDVLTALSVGALHRSPAEQVSVLRLIALITARYNWQRDELSVGQSEMARIWGVHDRTVKREVRRLQEGGLLLCLRPGVRGRVASYRLDRAGIERFSRPVWDLLGADFASRAGQVMGTAPPTNVVRLDFGTPDAAPAQARPAAGPAGSWAAVLDRLQVAFPEATANWYRRLSLAEYRDGVLVLGVPNPFVRDYVATHLREPLAAAATSELGPVRQIDFTLTP